MLLAVKTGYERGRKNMAAIYFLFIVRATNHKQTYRISISTRFDKCIPPIIILFRTLLESCIGKRKEQTFKPIVIISE